MGTLHGLHAEADNRAGPSAGFLGEPMWPAVSVSDFGVM